MSGDRITVIVGTQWGDEGKGKITDYCGQDADYVVRFHGGNNAGHTVIVGDKVYKFHLLPSGVLSEHAISVIGNGVVVDPRVLLKEIQDLKNLGIEPRLKISQRAHVIMPYHTEMDNALSGHQAQLAAGSTGRGIAPVYADKMYRHGIRMGDLLEPELFYKKLVTAYLFNTVILEKLFDTKTSESFSDVYNSYLQYGKELSPYITDTELELYQAFRNNKKILFEGAQGMSLDPDHGMYPHTTSSNNVAGHAEVGSGVGLNCKKRIIGVAKAYVSRVGKSPFVTELTDELGDHIREKGGEYGTTTGRARRVGWLDIVQLRQAVRTSGLTEIAMTKLDILGGVPKINICTGYEINGSVVTEMPASLTQLQNAKPIYTTLDGWNDLSREDVKRITKEGYPALPKEMRTYIEYVEQMIYCPIHIISLGPERNQTIVR